MFTQIMLSLLETKTGLSNRPVLADDFSDWFAELKWTWKPTSSRKAPPLPGKDSWEGVACSQANPQLPTPPISPRELFIESISTSPSSSSSFSSSNTPPTSTSALPPPPLFSTMYFEARPSPKGGIGAFATKNIAKGTIILAEKALFKAEMVEVFYAFEQLAPEQQREYQSLYFYPEIDHNRLLAIFKTNRFEISAKKAAIFLKSSRFNHACHPWSTCTYRYDNEQKKLVTTALFDIVEGEEITISYCGYGDPLQLRANYGFYCDCPQCPEPEIAEAQARFLRDGR